MTPDDFAGADVMSDFDLMTDARVTPLVPGGSYTGTVQSIKLSDDSSRMTIAVVLQGNSGFCSDGDTPLDNSVVSLTVFMPLDSDKDKMTASGKSSKWQWKINRLHEVMQSLNANVRTKKDIQDMIANGTLCGTAVTISVTTREYKGRISSEINNILIGAS